MHRPWSMLSARAARSLRPPRTHDAADAVRVGGRLGGVRAPRRGVLYASARGRAAGAGAALGLGRGAAIRKGDTVNSTHASGRIEVQTYDPQPYEEVDGGPNLVEVHVTETFSGDIEGEGSVRFLQAVRDDGSASFVGIERVVGNIAGRQGSFLLQDAGTLEGNN